MNRLLYYLIVKPISLLPFWALYAISDGFYFVVWKLLSYRKKVVLGNISNAFPDKTEKERMQIARGFYKHFCDLLVESVKGFSISAAQLDKRMKIEPSPLFEKYYAEGRSVVMASGHYCNWEMYAISGGRDFPQTLAGIYKRLNNAFWEGKMQTSRSRLGTEMIPTFKTSEYLANLKAPVAIALIMDQSPRDPKKGYWLDFLNQETPVLQGAEKYARLYNMPVIYGRIRKPKRGYYEVYYELVTDTPRDLPEGEILEKCTHILEQEILRKPDYWLWSHKRWKHKRPEGLPMRQLSIDQQKEAAV